MYWNDGPHARPHFHARYAGSAGSIDLDGDLIAGALALVAEYGLVGRAHRPRQPG